MSDSAPIPARIRGLRAATLAELVMLTVEYGFGMWVNLYARIPDADHSAGLAAGAAAAVVNGGLVTAIRNGPIGLSVHVALGILLLITGISVVVRAALVRRPLAICLAAIGLAALLIAAGSGARFLGQGGDNASFVMSLAAGVAIVCYAVLLFTAGARPQRASEAS